MSIDVRLQYQRAAHGVRGSVPPAAHDRLEARRRVPQGILRRDPVSCTGVGCPAPGNGGFGSCDASSRATVSGPLVSGRTGGPAFSSSKRKAEVRSPNVLRRQSLMFGSRTPVNFSRNCSDRGVVERLAADPAAGGPRRNDDAGTRKPPPIGKPVHELARRAGWRRRRRDVVEDAVVLVVVEDERRLRPDVGVGGDRVDLAGDECRAGGRHVVGMLRLRSSWG